MNKHVIELYQADSGEWLATSSVSTFTGHGDTKRSAVLNLLDLEKMEGKHLKKEADRELIDDTLELAGEFEWFDDSFLLSMDEVLEKYGTLTDEQRSATLRIQEMLESKL